AAEDEAVGLVERLALVLPGRVERRDRRGRQRQRRSVLSQRVAERAVLLLRARQVVEGPGDRQRVDLEPGVVRGAQRLDLADRDRALVLDRLLGLVIPSALDALALLDALDRGAQGALDARAALALGREARRLRERQRREAVPVHP